MTRRIEVSTTDYQATYGRMPRGEGTWAFLPSRNADAAEAFFTNGTYSIARQAAIAWARREGHPVLFVGP